MMGQKKMLYSSGLAVLLLLMGATLAAQNEAIHRGKHRVILLFVPDATNPEALAQDRELSRDPAGVRERDLVVYRIGLSEGRSTLGQVLDLASVKSLRKKYGVKNYQFRFFLKGKDGGMKLRRTQPIAMEELFAIIDSMPMRQAELGDY